MLQELINESNITLTENGAVTYAGTGSDCLDLFSTAGALRHAEDKDITDRFIRAYNEDPDAAMKILFFARDVRGGLGERRLFRVALRWLAENKPASVCRNLKYVAEFGRYDDLLVLLGTPLEKDVMSLIAIRLEKDEAAMNNGGEVSLLAKWLPSVNASNKQTVLSAKRIARALDMTDADYRKRLVKLRAYIRIIENNLREKDYTFDYEKQPSRALFKYRAAFYKNDGERYRSFIGKVGSGEAVLHAANVAPYELVQKYLKSGAYGRNPNISEEERLSLNATWESLPDYGGDEDMLAVVDTSGSMYGGYLGVSPMPAAVAFSLGLYFADKNRGAFAGHFIEFSAKPQLIKLKGETFCDKLQYASSFCEVANTDIDAVFDLILRTAVKNKLPQKDLPKKLVMISDMEFDYCVENASLSNFENAKKKFEEHGYTLPGVVFWNAASRHGHQPVRMNEQGVILVSGVTPVLFSMIAGGNVTPYAFMNEVLGRERYAKICA
ncbi:MAG: DUF2828 family protein [Clostridia bacterium]|nr:DUF2828 family protein [Clostridia bacterium]